MAELADDSFLFNAQPEPELNHSQIYTYSERLNLALIRYHNELREAQCNPGTKRPVVLQISKLYNIAETTLRRHIKNPAQRTREETAL